MGSRLIKTGRPHTCNISTEESYPSTEPRLGDWRGAPSRSSCWVTERSSTTATPQASSSDAYPSPKVRSYCKKYTQGLAVITQRLEPSLETPSDKVSTGQPRWPTPLGLYAPAKGVNSTQGRHTYPLRPCKQYPSPSRLLCGVLSAFRPRGVPGPTSKLSLRVPAQMGRRETEHKGGNSKGEPAAFVLSCAQGGCACSRGLQAFAWERERASCASPFSRAADLLVREPWTFLL
jgi:hypothetical protein